MWGEGFGSRSSQASDQQHSTGDKSSALRKVCGARVSGLGFRVSFGDAFSDPHEIWRTEELIPNYKTKSNLKSWNSSRSLPPPLAWARADPSSPPLKSFAAPTQANAYIIKLSEPVCCRLVSLCPRHDVLIGRCLGVLVTRAQFLGSCLGVHLPFLRRNDVNGTTLQ